MLGDVSTVILYTLQRIPRQNYDWDSARSVRNHFSYLTERFDELIVVGEAPDHYLEMLYDSQKMSGLKRISLHSNKHNFFDEPCKMCPSLEEMTMEWNGLRKVTLSSCRNLQKVWIWNVGGPTKIVSTLKMTKNKATFSTESKHDAWPQSSMTIRPKCNFMAIFIQK